MKKEIKLNVAISILVILVVIGSTMIDMVSSTNALRTSLKTNYLQNNYNYTNKLAEGVQYVTSDLQQSIIAVAELSRSMNFDQNQLDILYKSENGHFNSIFKTDTDGTIKLISPKVIEIQDEESAFIVEAGRKIDANIVKRALTTKEPFISQPYISASGTLLMLVTAPILNENGLFEGVMAGTIYLEEGNPISNVFNSDKYLDGSYIYAVDQSGKIAYHSDGEHLFEDFSENPIVKAINRGKSGYEEITDADGEEYLAGYSYIENLEWGVVLLTPSTILHEPLNHLIRKIVTQSLAVLIVLLIIATFLVKRLTYPLTQLAEYSERVISNKKLNNPNDGLTINSKIYEINQLYRQLRIQLLKLSQEIQLDGLTGLANRKAFDTVIKEWTQKREPFALAMLDIDNFKSINDTYGHLVGDDVIKFLASILISFSREEEDLSFRYGGEEFGLLLKGKSELNAAVIMEQFRVKMANMQSPTGKPITVSVGVTSLQVNDETPETIINRADKALYQSKQAGKNRVTVYKNDGK
ncbi:sensor domain-containing diguanylate cyclase [Lysinibacillus fusiformis]|nr:sensor domain-containing diguanylate cyclase [Lysinibacillus fusiformis]